MVNFNTSNQTLIFGIDKNLFLETKNLKKIG